MSCATAANERSWASVYVAGAVGVLGYVVCGAGCGAGVVCGAGVSVAGGGAATEDADDVELVPDAVPVWPAQAVRTNTAAAASNDVFNILKPSCFAPYRKDTRMRGCGSAGCCDQRSRAASSS